MIDCETYGRALLTAKDYYRIESSVVDLYKELRITCFPIDPFKIAIKCGYELIPYSSLDKDMQSFLRDSERAGTSGRTKNGTYRIFYDDYNVLTRQRFTIMHEIGHIRLGHKEDSQYAEKCANYFATYSLAPSPAMSLLNCEDFVDVSLKFGISDESAIYSFDRYCRWFNVTNDLKPYEERLIELLENNI